MDPATPQHLVEQLISWMRAESVTPTRTRLMKYLYLADLQFARYRDGRTFTGWSWYVHHFGPMASEAYVLLDRGVRDRWIRQNDLGWSDDDDRRAVVYDVVDKASPATVQLPTEFGKLRVWIKEYGDSQNQLLRFVYGSTEPMEQAREGDCLDFTTARRPLPAPSTAAAHALPPKTRRKLEELMKSIRSEYEATRATSVPDGPRDEHYYAGLPTEDEAPVDGNDYVTLHFPKD